MQTVCGARREARRVRYVLGLAADGATRPWRGPCQHLSHCLAVHLM